MKKRGRIVITWLEELTAGNAGVACTVTLDENGDPVSAAVG